MFIQNKYTNYYYNIINYAKQRKLDGYSERHHIIPKSLGGPDTKDNLVKLTSREHYICHALLVRMVESKQHLYKMMSAFNMMHVDAHGNRYTSRLYESHKHKYYKLKSEIPKGTKRTLESRRKQSASTKGKPWSEAKRNSKMHKPTAKPVLAYKKDTGEFVGEFESISLCAKELNCDCTTVWKICRHGLSLPAPNGKVYTMKSHKGYTFKYKED
ncbi:MAG: HNH endonuclease [Nitrososphaeraceae archaeon]